MLVICQTSPGPGCIHHLEPIVDRIKHHQHRLDGRVVPPEEQVPRLVGDPVGRRGALWQRVCHKALAEHASALPGGVREVLPSVAVGEVAGSRGDVPVQKEQRGQPLLSVEGT